MQLCEEHIRACCGKPEISLSPSHKHYKCDTFQVTISRDASQSEPNKFTRNKHNEPRLQKQAAILTNTMEINNSAHTVENSVLTSNVKERSGQGK